jgi:hypothetical protein
MTTNMIRTAVEAPEKESYFITPKLTDPSS